ncbi:MAG: lytic transglycosylase domain-containing protein [Candidatus Peribacteria bacterium]|jgi:hypothetical protein|nr:lytic transglycosylase domain-containing protein [Candidatus Peribacteria bacterium]
MSNNVKIKALQVEKEQKEQKIKEVVDQLATLSSEARDEAKETIKQQLKQLKIEREEILGKLKNEIGDQLTATVDEIEKANLQDLLEKYEREEWENQSYYLGVITIIEQDTTENGLELQTLLKIQEKAEQQERVSTISTYELLKTSTTADNLKVALGNTSLDKRFEKLGVSSDPEKRLEATLERAHEVAKQFVDWKLFDSEAEKQKNPELVKYAHEVIAPGIERYLLELLKGKEGEDNHANNQEVLSFLQNFKVNSIKGAFDSAMGLAQGASEAYVAIKSMTRALDFLSIHKKDSTFLQKLKTADMLRNPAHFRDFLLLPEWQNKDAQGEDSDLYKVKRDQLQIPFDPAEKAFGLTEQDKQEVLVRIGSIDVQPTPETASRILDLMEKSPDLLKGLQKGKESILKTGDALSGPLSLFESLGVDLTKYVENNPVLKGIINFVLSLFGFPGGFDGWKRRKFQKPIEEDLGNDIEAEARRNQIADLYASYQQTLPADPKPEDSLYEIYNKKGIRFLKNSEQFFKIDQPTLQATLKDKLDTATLNPLAVKAVLGGTYVKTVDKKLVVDTEKIEQNKDLFIENYLKFSTQHLAKNADYLSKIDSTDTVVFTMISSLFVQEKHVINGIKAEIFLPGDFIETTEIPQPAPQIPSSVEHQTNETESLQGYTGELMYFDNIPGTEEEKKAFKAKVEEISKELQINPNRLMLVMKKESGLKHAIVNKEGGATGLIQFMPTTAKNLGTSTEKLKQMTAVQQLEYVKKYYQKNAGNFKSYDDLRLYTFFPAAMGKPDDYVFETPTLSAQTIAKQNHRGKDQITMADYKERLKTTVTENVPPEYQNQFA